MRFYDRDGSELDNVMDWYRLRCDPERCLVAHTRVVSIAEPAMGVEVFTSWVGIDTWDVPGTDRPPLIFETMTNYKSAGEITCDRWENEHAARIGHTEMVALAAATIYKPRITDLDAFGRTGGPSWVGAPLPPPAPEHPIPDAQLIE